ncbi:membrane protein [Spirochaetia bacterium]|nr:membrane protein [Spirochaetia bacterium]
MEIIHQLTDPYLNWFRRFSFLRAGAIDFSPIAAIGVLSLVNTIVQMLARFGTIRFGLIGAVLLSILWSVLSFLCGFCAIVVALSLIAYFSGRNLYSPFWNLVESASRPILYRINRLLFRDRMVQYRTSMFIALGLSVGILVLGHFGVGLLSSMLMQLPF